MASYKPILRFLALFFGSFCLFYYTSLFLIGAADPRGMVYWPRFTAAFDVFGWLTDVIVRGAMALLKGLGYEPVRSSFNRVQLGHYSIGIASICLGYGVMSFWLAFVVANRMSWKARLAWAVAGLFSIYVINTVRIVLIVLGKYHHWFNPREVTHDLYHTTFNISAYGFLFLLMWLFSRWDKRQGMGKE